MKKYIYYDAETNEIYVTGQVLPVSLFQSFDELKESVVYLGEL